MNKKKLIIIIIILIGIIITLKILLDQSQARNSSTELPKDILLSNDELIDGDEKTNKPDEILKPQQKHNYGEILSRDDYVQEPGFPISLSYDRYLNTFTYYYIESDDINIYSGPSEFDIVLGSAMAGDRLDFFESIDIATEDGNKQRWIHATWDENGEKRFGFIKESDAVKRRYQFDKVEESIKVVESYCNNGKITYISNYKDINGKAPLYNGKAVDNYGNSRNQSAPAYPNFRNVGEFRYIEDGTLVRYLFSDGDYAKIQVVYTGEQYYVPQKYIPSGHKIHDLTRVIAVDVTNQNELVYEKISGLWTLVSYSHATTGTTGKYSQPTPVGYYFGIEKKPYFRYYEDGTTRIQGYAPYAIRFAGGAYIHGIPVNYKYADDGSLITPPEVEYSKTIGTIPRSHKCVRNYTSHAKFLYDWYVSGETIVIVID